MPIYEYHCLDCGKNHEIFQKVSDKLLRKCPACGGKIKKNISLAGFQLKGSGWYKDGYTSAKKEPSGEGEKKVGEKPTTTKEPQKASEKSEAKSAPKKEASTKTNA